MEVNESFGTFKALKYISITLCFFTFFCTSYDFLTSLFSIKPPSQLFLSFSLRKNVKTLFNTKEDKHSITSIHGIRSISTLCIMTQHIAYFRAQSPFISKKVLMDFALSEVGEAVSKLTGSVDSFLVITGALLVRVEFASIKKNKFSKTKIILQRFLSITPCLAFVILFDDVLTRLAIKNEKGLLTLNDSVKNCWTYWWSVLLHIQNYFNPTKLCMSTSWYLDVDFQMFLIAPFLILLLWRYKERSLLVICGLILAICLIGFKTSIDHEFVVNDYHFGNVTTDLPAASLIYLPTHIRGMPFLVGIVLGYFIFIAENSENPKMENSTVLQKVFTALSLYVFSTPVTTIGIDFGRAPIPNSLYIGFGRLLWSAATAWIIYSCHVGLNKLINKFLSHRFWIPFGRMGLSVYLVHPVVYRFNAFQQKENVSFELQPINMLIEFLVILLCSMLFYLVIQEPMNQTTKFVMKKFFEGENVDKKKT